jgi:hypothetical protein
MATIFSGERLLSVYQYTDDSNGTLGPHTFYTVPAGRYAKVTFHRVRFGNSASINTSSTTLEIGDIAFNKDDANPLTGVYGGNGLRSFNSTGDIVTVDNDAAMRGAVEFIMTSGQTITKTTASGSDGGIEIWVTIQEFANPS